MNTTQNATTVTPPRPRKPLMFRIGIGFVSLTALLYLSALVTLFLPLDPGVKAAVIGGEILVAELSFLAGVACMGKEAYRALKARLRRRRARKPDSSAG